LILCNLLARKDAMIELGGFNEALYPNEENALMDELQNAAANCFTTRNSSFTAVRATA